MKAIFSFFCYFLVFGNAFCQYDRLYVITDVVNVREKPDFKAKVMGTLKLGDSVIVTGHSNHQSTATIDGVKKTANWVEIIYNYKEAYWVFGGALCEQVIDYKSVKRFMIDSEKKQITDFEQLVKDSILTFGGTFIKLKTQNGEQISIKFSVCNTEDQNTDGHLLTGAFRNQHNPHIIEVIVSQVAFWVTTYVDLKRGKKFTFKEQSYISDNSSISPDGKYIAGSVISSQQPIFAIFDFDKTGKPTYQIVLDDYNISHQWLSNTEIEITYLNTKRKKVLLVPQMQWKK
jgi:hypothetical protein